MASAKHVMAEVMAAFLVDMAVGSVDGDAGMVHRWVAHWAAGWASVWTVSEAG